MAESQVPYRYTASQIKAIRNSISEPRFAIYLAEAGNHEEYALALYLYNARLAKAFLYPLHIVEVTLRNTVDKVLVNKFCDEWYQDRKLREELLVPEALQALDKAIIRAGYAATRDDIVAKLTFDFWSNLFRSEYGDLWRTQINVAFPHLIRGQSRKHIQDLVKPINLLRNRVAHHEPLLDLNVTDNFSKITSLVALRCQETAAWMKHYSTLNTVIRTRPKLNGVAVSLASNLNPSYVSVQHDTTLMQIMEEVGVKKQPIICIDGVGKPTAAFTMLDLTSFIAEKAKKLEGLVSLAELSVADFLGGIDVSHNWVRMDEDKAFAEAIEQLLKPKIQILVGVNPKSGAPTGAIVRAHRRY